ncbi:hypothetical protein P154DRAFT_86091 [Amniculicola lignicola CBS 123094]|uniref:INSIG domain-containing protein n=1 Tax=Amniculicola lignicola CBS 123094 TaxID=1392246 RepID=A0A6A5WR66_9PLEO|nr:hypothetical protein P154DRAFT_86091 [Amniculicola lignicola CBS 123094]
MAEAQQQQRRSEEERDTETPHIYQPIPRRNFQPIETDSPDPFPPHTPPSLHDSNNRSSDWLAQLNARLLRTRHNSDESSLDDEGGGMLGNGFGFGHGSRSLEKNKSFLNMTSSTLFGIYDDEDSSTAEEKSEVQTPWGTGAETPGRQSSVDSGMAMGAHGNGNANANGRGSLDAGLKMKDMARRGTVDGKETLERRRPSIKQTKKEKKQGMWKGVTIAGKLAALFLFGAVYGLIVSMLHQTKELAAVRVGGGVDRESWAYFASWGIAGVSLGSLLPYVDLLWAGEKQNERVHGTEEEKEPESSLGEQWNEVVRSVGAFIGIAFAIRRLPWQSTLQLTITLALVNPALWYILDRSKPGLSVSLIVSSILTSFIFLSNPDVLPSPALPAIMNATLHHSSAKTAAPRAQHPQSELFAGVVSYDNLAVVTWVGSVVFCSSVCFGSIGRRLAVLDDWGWKR